jgi:hypothetical protein
VQPGGDRLPVQPADHQPQHLTLPVGELAERWRERLSHRVLRGGQHQAEQASGEPGAAEHRGPDRGDDVVGGPVLGHEAHRARLDGTDGGRGVGVTGQDHHHRRIGQRHHRGRELDAADVAQLYVHDHRVGPLQPDGTDHLVGVGDRRQGLEVRFRAEQRLQALGKDLVVIDDEQLGRCHNPTAVCSRGQPLVSTSPSRTA